MPDNGTYPDPAKVRHPDGSRLVYIDVFDRATQEIPIERITFTDKGIVVRSPSVTEPSFQLVHVYPWEAVRGYSWVEIIKW